MRVDSFILNDLPEFLIDQWYDLDIYNESDMQCCTYFWLRDYFDNDRSGKWIIRTQPTTPLDRGTYKPDISIFKHSKMYDAIELKCQLDGIDDAVIDRDIEKFHMLKTQYNLRHAYQLVLYDDNDILELPSYWKEDWMKDYLTLVPANVRKHPSGRRRNKYESARKRWERFR
jgi:hypothetical protein